MSLRDRLGAMAHGEVSTAGLGAYASANTDAYSLLDDLPATGNARAAAWCAFVLQTHADDLLASGSSPGFASEEICEECQMVFQLVSTWLGRSRQAAADPSYRLDVVVPQPLPQPRAARTPNVLKAMRKTLETIQARVGADIAERGAEPVAARVRPMMSVVQSAIDASAVLVRGSVGIELAASLTGTLQGGLDRAYQIGQLLSLPDLIAHPAPPVAPTESHHDASSLQLFLPGDPGFDRWCLTDPIVRARQSEAGQSKTDLDAFWAADPEPAKTLAVQAEIAAALERGIVDYLPERASGAFTARATRCPWPGVLYAKTPVTIAGTMLQAGDSFIFSVGRTETGFERTLRAGHEEAGFVPESAPATDGLSEWLDRLAGDHPDP
jgi:hypothetical protein